jgi:putative pyruvate formate lyase activating enzyme
MRFEPCYLRTYESGALQRRVKDALRLMADCAACPRDCHVNRLADEKAICRTGRYAVVSSHFAHFGEEDCLRGWNGSGTIFFSWCNLRCPFCQNYSISHMGEGLPVTPQRLAAMMLDLQRQGCHNINFVTPEHVVPQILEAMPLAVAGGLRVPIVYNTSAYDSMESLRLMDGVVDVYMPDFKYWSAERAQRYLKARDYPEAARRVIKEMHRQVGDLVLDERGLARRGLMIRHLVMPGHLDETREILRWIAEEIGPNTYINIMAQYHPAGKVNRELYPEINRRITSEEYEEAVQYAREVGLTRLDPRWTRGRV